MRLVTRAEDPVGPVLPRGNGVLRLGAVGEALHSDGRAQARLFDGQAKQLAVAAHLLVDLRAHGVARRRAVDVVGQRAVGADVDDLSGHGRHSLLGQRARLMWS